VGSRRLLRSTLAVFDVPEVAAVDVPVLGEVGKRQPGIGASLPQLGGERVALLHPAPHVASVSVASRSATPTVFRALRQGATVGPVIADVALPLLVLLGPAALALLVPPRHRRPRPRFRGRHACRAGTR
jgi:hypothetical protein